MYILICKYLYIDIYIFIYIFIYDRYVFLYILIYLYIYIYLYKTGVPFIGHQAEPQQKTYTPLMLDFIRHYKQNYNIQSKAYNKKYI